MAGIATERNAAISSRNASPSMKQNTSGVRAPSCASKSWLPAVSPAHGVADSRHLPQRRGQHAGAERGERVVRGRVRAVAGQRDRDDQHRSPVAEHRGGDRLADRAVGRGGLGAQAATARPTRGPSRSLPVTTTSAGAGPPGNACWMASRVRTTGMLVGRSWMPESSRCSESTGAASASSATVASPPSASGRRTTAQDHGLPQPGPARAAACRLPRNGIRPRSVALAEQRQQRGQERQRARAPRRRPP